MKPESYELLEEQVRKRIEAGDTAWAIERLRSLTGESDVAPDVYRLLAMAHLKEGAQDAAMAALKDARRIHTSSKTEVGFGRFLNREGYKEAALNCFVTAADLEPENADALALACKLKAELGQLESALVYGQRSLEARDRQVAGQPDGAIGAVRPKPFDPATPDRNIIAFSLFGDNPYYWDSAIAVASMALAIFPEWRCRFYCDPNVPEAVRQTLIRLRSQLFVSPDRSVNWSGLFWRFWAFDDPNVDVVMVRDVDSPFTLRERLAVEEWLASGLPFHVIRDHHNHSEPMMAGLWGGWTRLLPPMRSLIKANTGQVNDRFSDQEFLRLHVWPRIRAGTLTHDRYYKLGETRRPPHHSTEKFTHIGMGWPRTDRKVAASTQEDPLQSGMTKH
jgi:tetratricopeptide (TPR) repeat protein